MSGSRSGDTGGVRTRTMATTAVGPTRTAGQVAQHLGVAESTLRAWHRRYDVGPVAPRPGAYRRYSEGDVARLERMRDLIRGGTLPSDAAASIARSATVSSPTRLLPDLLAAVRQLDSGRCLSLLSDALTAWGPIEVWDRIYRPAATSLDREQRTVAECRGLTHIDCVESEHTLSWAMAAALHRHRAVVARSAGAPVLLACTDAEHHTLALEALSVALADHLPVRMLGAAVPTASLVHAAATAKPRVVVLWSQRTQTALSDPLRALRGYPLRRVAAGPGWSRLRLVGVEKVNSLSAAVDLVLNRTLDATR